MTTKQIPDETIIRSFIDLAAENGCSVAPEIQRQMIAAPELLECLIKALGFIDLAVGVPRTEIQDQIRAAIAKATNPNAGEVPAFPKGRW